MYWNLFKTNNCVDLSRLRQALIIPAIHQFARDRNNINTACLDTCWTHGHLHGRVDSFRFVHSEKSVADSSAEFPAHSSWPASGVHLTHTSVTISVSSCHFLRPSPDRFESLILRDSNPRDGALDRTSSSSLILQIRALSYDAPTLRHATTVFTTIQ